MRRLTDIYAQLASDRDAAAQRCALYVLEKEWDRAAIAAKDFQFLQDQCSALVTGSLASFSPTLAEDPGLGPEAA